MPLDVLALGAVSLDEILYVEDYPSADSKVRVLRRVESLGGLAGTALVAASRLGVRCAYAGQLGTCGSSAVAEALLENEGIDLSHVVRAAGAAPSRSVIVAASQPPTRTVLSVPSALRGASPSGPPESVITDAAVLLVDHVGVPGMIRAARVARNAGREIVGDLERRDHPDFETLLKLVGHLVVSAPFASELTGARDAQSAVAILAKGRRAAVVTCGSEGCWAAAGESVRHYPAFVVTVADTIGCGDVFHGAYAAGLARGMDLHSRITLASAAAALKAEAGGGIDGIPTLEAAMEFLEGRGAHL